MVEAALGVPVRTALSKWFPVIVAVLLVVAAGSGYVAYTAQFEPETTTEQRTVGTWSVASDFEHSAVVERDTAVFNAGDRLADRRLYFTGVTPRLDGRYVVSHESSDGDPAFVTAELRLVVRAVETIDGEEVVHWRESEVIATAERELPSGDSMDVEFTIDAPRVDRRVSDIEDDLGASAGTSEVLVRADTAVEGSAGGETFTDTRTGSLTVDVGGSTYAVTSAPADRSSYEATATTEVAAEPSAFETYGSAAVAVAAVLATAALFVGRRRDTFAVGDAERARYEFEADRDEFSEWITPGQVPDGEYATVELGSLRAVVDIAIDSGRRVLETPAGRYVVLLEDKQYVYEPRLAPARESDTGPEPDESTERRPADDDPFDWSDDGDTGAAEDA